MSQYQASVCPYLHVLNGDIDTYDSNNVVTKKRLIGSMTCRFYITFLKERLLLQRILILPCVYEVIGIQCDAYKYLYFLCLILNHYFPPELKHKCSIHIWNGKCSVIDGNVVVSLFSTGRLYVYGDRQKPAIGTQSSTF